MRILVHEHASGGGCAGRHVPRALAREGAAMLAALLEDLAAIREHQIVTTTDPRFPLVPPRGVDVVTLGATANGVLDDLIASVDAVWFIAPETDRCLERLTARAERMDTALLGSGSAAIRRASDKAALPRLLARHGVPHPATLILRRAHRRIDIGFPVVIKPARGAGCESVSLARNRRDFDDAIRADAGRALLAQEFVPGVAASVSLLADGRRAVPLAVNAQHLRVGRSFSYRGGATPLKHPMADRAADTAVRACEAIRGLRGYVGVDVVLTDSAAVVIEVNPRLTTSYLGVRAALRRQARRTPNIAALVLGACDGRLADPPPIRQAVRFTAGGRVER